jgi:hypothetical protein
MGYFSCRVAQRFLADNAATTFATHRANDTLGWLDGFIQQVGLPKALFYLEDAGVVQK